MYSRGLSAVQSGSYCMTWVSRALAKSEEPGASGIYFITSQPGPFLSEITADMYDIVRSSGYTEAVRQLTCFAMWSQTKTNMPVSQWMTTVGNAMLALVKPKIAAIATRATMMTSARPTAIQPSPAPAPLPAQTGEEQLAAPQPTSPWLYVGIGVGVLAAGGLAYYFLVKKKR